MDDASLVKTIAQFRIDIADAMTPLKALHGELYKLDKTIQNIQAKSLGVGRTISTGLGVQAIAPVKQGGVILDQYGNTLSIVSAQATKATAQTKQYAKETAKTVAETKELNRQFSVLGSQWERRVSWFLAGVAFYGGIRAMGQAVSIMSDVESQMVIIERTTRDATFSLTHMRDELMRIGQEFGHGWDVVSNIAIEWTRAGYNVADTLELVRTSLLALNVAEMDVQQATQGLIAIMAQWGFEVSELETVIDKLNITSDRFPVTTGDLIDALLRSSGAARAANIEFDDLIGMITATRVASGRAGREIGNAMNTILSYITRQSTINKLMASGIQVFEDAAQTRLRPALNIMADVTEKWLDNAEQMPQELVDIADSMGLFEEELADIVGLTEEWTDLQKIEIEQSIAGVRRRQFLIALMRNFAQVQDVVNNLQGVEGYSMAQNIRTMQTLEKQYEQLRMEMTKLATALGDAGVLGQMKALVSMGKDAASFFAGLNDATKTYILTLGELALALSITKAMISMMGGGALLAKASALAGPWGLVATAGAAAIASLVIYNRQLKEEQQQYVETISQVAKRQEQLNKIIENSIKGSTAYNTAMEEKRELARAVAEQYPDLIAGYDAENKLIVLNNYALQEAIKLKEKSIELDKEVLAIQDKKVQEALDEVEAIRKQIEQNEQQAQQYNNDANTLQNLAQKRKALISEIEQEGIKAEELAQKKKELEYVDDAIIRVSVKLTDTIKANSDITVEALNKVIDAYKEQGEAARQAKIDMINQEIDATEKTIKLIQERLRARQQEFQVARRLKFMELEVASEELIEKGAINPLDPYYYSTTDVSAYQRYAEALGDEETKRIQRDIMTYDELLRLQEKTLKDLEEQLASVASTMGGGDGGGVGGGGLGNETQKLTDIINKYIESALRAADAQGMLNDEIQREMDGLQARIKFYDKENATAWERNQVLQDEARLRELARQKQEGNHREANLLRGALAKLEQKQASINTSTEEGWEAYKQLESQIESIKDTISRLGTEWFSLQEIIDDNTRKIREIENAYKNAISTLDYFNRFGIYTIKQYLNEVNRIYSQFDALTLDQERDLYSRRYDAYKEMLNNMKRDAEDAYRERIALLERETEQAIALLQQQLEALDEEKELEDREEARRQHEQKIEDLLEQRYYHQLRTGIEHERAIVDIDRQIAEEERRWQLQQSEWERQDRRDALNRQIEDIRERAEEQRKEWEKAYERMQRDFSEHNLSLIALASAFDPAFWQDAKTKGELWVQGFKEGTAGFGSYLASLIPSAQTKIQTASRGAYTAPASNTTLTAHQKAVLESEGFKQMSEAGKKSLLESWGIPTSHTGSKVVSEGIASLIPGEIIFPPNLSLQLTRLIDVLSAKPLQPSIIDKGRIINFNAPFYNVEKQNLSDEVDAEIVFRELRRQIATVF